MRVTVDFPSYNARRYGRPWIAKVIAWPVGKTPELLFGGLVGHTTEIEATPGDIVRWGQRDNRGNNTQADWGIVENDGGIRDLTAEKAREFWLIKEASKVPPVDEENLREERDRLLAQVVDLKARLAEIEQLLQGT